MPISDLWQQAIFGMLGGLASEVLHWYILARKPRGIYKFSRDPTYWLASLSMVAFGGLAPMLYLSEVSDPLLSLHLGAATPVIVQKIFAAIPGSGRPQGTTEPSLKKFFAW